MFFAAGSAGSAFDVINWRIDFDARAATDLTDFE
jgi:hypothetical protein